MESEITKMAAKSSDYEIVTRAQYFRWNTKELAKQVAEHEMCFFDLDILRNVIVKFSRTPLANSLDKHELFNRIFSKIYGMIKKSELDFSLFCNNLSVRNRRPVSSESGSAYRGSSLCDEVYAVCLFSTLCTFLHDSKRIKGMTLREFVQDNHPSNFKNIDSQNYAMPSFLFAEELRLRKHRHKLLKTGKVYHKNTQWASMTKDAEHEWTFYYALDNAEETVRDTFKRIGNLYHDIDKAINSKQDDEFLGRLDEAYKRFSSKLTKIEYGSYLNLQQTIIDHILKDKEYFGLNLYRLERKLQPFIITEEVKILLACQTFEEELDFIKKSVVLKDITFPKLRKMFFSLPRCYMESCAAEFPGYLKDIACSSCLILDELVENGVFGEDWENLFRSIVNEMATSVLYNPKEIDFTVTEESQKKFLKVLSVPALYILSEEKSQYIWHLKNSSSPK